MQTQDSIPPARACCRQMLEKAGEYARNNPAHIAALSFSAGLLLNLLPTQAIARPIGVLAAKLLPPVLMGLGIIKVMELSCGNSLSSSPPPAIPRLRSLAESL